MTDYTQQNAPTKNECLKILLVLEAAGGGAGRHVLDLAGELRDMGHDVHLAWSPTRVEPIFQDEIAHLTGISVCTIPMRRSPHPADIKAVWQLRKYIKQHNGFDIVHGHSSKAGAIVRLLRSVGVGSRMARGLIYTPHGTRTIDAQLSAPARFVWATIERLLNFVGGNHSIAVSQHEHDHIVAHKISSAHRVHTVLNGLRQGADVSRRESVRAKFGLSTEDFCVGFVGRFSSVKGPLVFVDAVAKAKQLCAHLKVLMLGYGEMRGAVDERISALGLQDTIQIYENERGLDCVPAFDLFSMSSFQEGLPYVLLEAASAGVPVVATDAGGISSLVGSHNGRLVPIGDANQLGQAIGELATNRAGYSELRKNALRSRDQFSARQMTEATLDVYRSVHGVRSFKPEPAKNPAEVQTVSS